MSTPTLRTRDLLAYGLFALPVAFAGFPLYVLAPDFYATHHGLSLATLGFILLALRFFDALQDPLIGYYSDRYPAKRMLIMSLCALLVVAGIYALFHPMGNASIWFTGAMLVTVTAYSALSINLGSLGALWSSDSAQQTRITTTREAFGLIGLLVAVSLPGVLAATLEPSQIYGVFSLILAGVMLLSLVIFMRWKKRQQGSLTAPLSTAPRLRDMWTSLSLPTKKLFAVYGLSMLASSIPAVLVIFFVRDLLGAYDYLGLFLLLYFLSGALTMPLWKIISARLGLYRAWMLGMLLAVVSFVWAFFLGNGDMLAYGIICVLSGTALGADLALPPALLAANLHQSNKLAHSSTQFAMLALLAKAALAIASALVLPALEYHGFSPATANSADALFALSAAYALLPCTIKLMAAILLYCMFIRNQGAQHDTHAITSGSRTHA